MQKIDRLGWTEGFTIDCHGVRVGVRSNHARILDSVWELLPYGWKRSRAQAVDLIYSFVIGGAAGILKPDRFNILYGDIARIARSKKLDDLFDAFERDLKLRVAEMATTRIFIHAGVVAWKGKAILLPGRTFTGKTTLVRELIRAGAVYYSDEYAVLDNRGRVHPYARPLGIRRDETHRQFCQTAESLGGRTGTKPLPVGLVVFSEYREGARWRPRKLSPGQGALELLANVVPARKRPKDVMTILKLIVSTASMVKGTRGEAASVVYDILNKMETDYEQESVAFSQARGIVGRGT